MVYVVCPVSRGRQKGWFSLKNERQFGQVWLSLVKIENRYGRPGEYKFHFSLKFHKIAVLPVFNY